MRTVVLRDERGPEGTRWLSASTRDGDLVIEGQDLGPGVSAVFGPDRTEYEWYETIRAEHLPSVVAGLGGRPGQDVLDLLEQCCVEPRTDRLREVFEERQIPVERWIRVGD